MNIISSPLLEEVDPKFSAHEEMSFDTSLVQTDWVKRFMEKPKFSYEFVDFPELPDPNTESHNNEYNLNNDDKNIYPNKLDGEVLDQFIAKAREPFLTDISYNIEPISSISSYRPSKQIKIKIPPTYDPLFYQYLSVQIKPFTIHGSTKTLTDYSGIIFLFDTNQRLPISESVYFIYNDMNIQFIVAKSDTIYFRIPNDNPNIVLACMLFNNDVEKLESYKLGFVPKNGSNNKLPSNVPFATSFIPIFPPTEDTGFVTTFSAVDPSNAMSKVGIAPTVDDVSILLVGRAIIKKLDIKDVPVCQFSSKFRFDYPFLALNCQSKVFDTRPVITLSNISFTFSKATEGCVVGFRVFMSEVQTNMNNPDGLIGFVPKEGGNLVKCYESFTVLPDKHVVFPDVVRYFPQAELEPESHFIIQFLIYKQQKIIVYKSAIVELMKDKVISTGYKTYPTNHVKNIPIDYLIKLVKAQSQSTVSFYIDIPASFILQPQFKELSECLVPMQVKWETIANLPMPILKSQLLPVVAKLLSIISPQTIQFVVNLFTMFDNDKEWNTLLRSWIYHYFDPSIMKHNFLSSFTNSLDQLLQEVIKGDLVTMKNILRNIDIISVILLISFLKKTETWVPQSLITLLNRLTDFTCWMIQIGQQSELGNFCGYFGQIVSIFSSLIDAKTMIPIINRYISSLLALNEQRYSLEAIFEFMEPFSRWNDFIFFLSQKIPVRPIGNNWISPFQPTLSLLMTVFDRTFQSNNIDLIHICAAFITDMTISIETLEIRDRFRVGYALFPVFDILARNYVKVLDDSAKQTLLPCITFLMGYIPRLQLHVYFRSVDAQHQKAILKFIRSAFETCNSLMTPASAPNCGLVYDLTKRILMFISTNIDEFGNCVDHIINLLASLFSSDYQVPTNFPRIFICVVQIISRYPDQKLLLSKLLPLLSKKQHIARCFATSLILLFFKAEFHAKNHCLLSGAAFFDYFATILFALPVDKIPMYRMMCERIIEKSESFNDQDFVQEISSKFEIAMNIIELVTSLRNSAHEITSRCEFIMRIANQYSLYPSMRMKWLKEIVQTNIHSKCFSSAFVAQLHVCALISTVIDHENKRLSSHASLPVQHNLIVCQPISLSSLSPSLPIFPRDFEFIPSVMIETQIDFDQISENFKIVSQDFDMNLLQNALQEAYDLGVQAKMYYTIRCVRSMQIRAALSCSDYSKVSELSKDTDIIYKNLSLSASATFDVLQKFIVVRDSITVIDIDPNASLPNGTIVRQYDPESNHTEHSHAWRIFRSTPEAAMLKSVESYDSKDITLTQYTTKHYLPRYVSYSPIVDVKEVNISLMHHADLETDRLSFILTVLAEGFERFFPTRNVSNLIGDYKLDIERDMRCISYVLDSVHGPRYSLFYILKILSEKGGADIAKQMAIRILKDVQRLVKVYHRAIEYLQSEEHFLSYARMSKARNAFISYFGLSDIDTKGFEGRKDWINEKCDFEN